MSYHAVLAKGSGIVISRKAPAKPQRHVTQKKAVSSLWRTGHHSYSVESLPPQMEIRTRSSKYNSGN